MAPVFYRSNSILDCPYPSSSISITDRYNNTHTIVSCNTTSLPRSTTFNTFLPKEIEEQILSSLEPKTTPLNHFSRKIKMPSLMGVLSILFFFVLPLVILEADAFCECGYTFASNAAGSLDAFIVTDLIETDFLHETDVSKDTDWSIQGYEVTAEQSRGTYGTNFTTVNVLSNPIHDTLNWTGPGVKGGLPGMQLIVTGGTPLNGSIDTAQVNSVRTDLLYGSYRFLANLPKLNGTCTAMFDYYNDSQEVDIEILTSQFFINGTHLINLVQQTEDSAARGYSIPGQDYFVTPLPFDPTDGFHEYRFDVTPGRINFFGDNIFLGDMGSPPPAAPRHLIVSHWSNGNPLWSAGPPVEDAIMTIGYVKAYFNSSDPGRQAAASSRCRDPTAPGAYCPIPDEILLGNTLFSEFFFAQPNKTNDQTVFGKKNDAPAGVSLSLLVALMSVLALGFISCD